MKHLSLFSGIGGLDLAAEWAGFESAGQVEIDDYCNKVLQKHWPDVPKWRDIYQLTGEEVKEKCGSISLLSGGFPCQPFSCAGKRRGTEDERYLWGEMLRIICEVRPRWVVAENVRGLLSIDAGRTFGTVLSDLAENGYRVGWLCYGAGDVGAPHKRERVFIMGYAEGNGNSQQRCTHNRKNCTGQDRPIISHKSGGFGGEGQVAYTNNTGDRTPRNGTNRNGQTENEGRAEQSFVGVSGQGENIKTDRATEPAMGRVPSRFSPGMDGNWPAGPGEQHEWEPPRIAIGVKDRVARLKALGNAVVPQQVYPILKAIAEIEGVSRP